VEKIVEFAFNNATFIVDALTVDTRNKLAMELFVLI